MSRDLLLLAAVLATCLCGCVSSVPGPDEVVMVLPVGDPERGRHAFASLQCGSCHEVQDEPDLAAAHRIGRAPVLIRGRDGWSAGDWATAIVAPGHETSWDAGTAGGETDLPEVEMPPLWDRMSVGDLMDLVAFLERPASSGS